MKKITKMKLGHKNFSKIVKSFIENIRSRAIGQNVVDSITPAQMIIKIVNDELTEILGSGESKLNVDGLNPKKIMFIGLQGSGKTTSVGKLAKYIKDKYSQNILLVSLDVNRPAAFEQLQILGEKINIKTLSRIDKQNPIDIIKRSQKEAQEHKMDFILYDTAGRINIDDDLLRELKIIENEIDPIETLLVLDSLTGQEAMRVAKDFSEIVKITGSILTRVDGDSRGGAALSMKMATGCPIKFMGIGEQVEDLEIFYPERISNRILGMGDIVSLVEKASENINHQDAEILANKMQKGEFDLNDLLNQIKQMNKMGGISSIMKFIPGLKNINNAVNDQNVHEDSLKQQEAIILSMTPYERKKPKVINGSRKKRIAKGSGTVVSDINKILKQHRKMSDMMKQLSKKGMGNINSFDLGSQLGSGLTNNVFKK